MGNISRNHIADINKMVTQHEREEIARLREALGGIYDTANWYVTPLAAKICKLAQAALAKEATRDHAE